MLSPPATRLLAQEARALLTGWSACSRSRSSSRWSRRPRLSAAAQTAIERYLAQARASCAAWCRLSALAAPVPVGTRPARRGAARFTFCACGSTPCSRSSTSSPTCSTQRSEHDNGRLAVRASTSVAADALRAAGAVLRGAAGDLLPRPRHRRGDPPRAHAPARRRREPGGDHPRAARAHGRQRHRLVARARGRPPGARRCWISWTRCGRCCGSVAARAAAATELVAWQLWERWISEIVADFWSVARVGIAATLGLIGVVSLPRAFVFRINLDDPHPLPWIRVKLSCAMGEALYPHPQWERLGRIWEAFYPIGRLDAERASVIERLRATHARLCLAAGEPPARSTARALARGGTGIAGPPARAAGR